MFDLGWDEMALIAVVALVLLGPKELPNALRTVSGLMKNARKLAGEFQSGVNQIIREAELEDAKNAIASLNKDTIADAIEKHLDEGGDIKSALQKPMNESVNSAAIDAPTLPAISSSEVEINPASAGAETDTTTPLIEGDPTATPIEMDQVAADHHIRLRQSAIHGVTPPKIDNSAKIGSGNDKSKIS